MFDATPRRGALAERCHVSMVGRMQSAGRERHVTVLYKKARVGGLGPPWRRRSCWFRIGKWNSAADATNGIGDILAASYACEEDARWFSRVYSPGARDSETRTLTGMMLKSAFISDFPCLETSAWWPKSFRGRMPRPASSLARYCSNQGLSSSSYPGL